MEFHEAANIFPLLDDDRLAELADDIEAKGLINPIETYEGKILDGRNRYRACLLRGVEPTYYETDCEGRTPVEYVVSLNLHRRHLSETQRAMVGGRIKDYHAKLARDRQKTSTGGKIPQLVENLPEADAGRARDKAGEQLNVSGRTVDSAVKVLSKGIPELVAACDADKIAVSVAERIAEEPKPVQQRAVESLKEGKTGATVLREIQAAKHKAAVESLAAIQAKQAAGVYDVIVIDPPWPIQKVEREVRPNQSASLDYPTMTVAQIAELEIPAADDCLLFCWTTQRFLPDTFGLLEEWGFQYSVTFVWHKPGGFQPVGQPQYNCEFVVMGRRGGPQFVDTKAFALCFEAKRGRHSEKPEAFYELLRRVTAGRRLDMFSRRRIEGFEAWGNEASQ